MLHPTLPPAFGPPPAESHGGWLGQRSPPRGDDALCPSSALLSLRTLGRFRPHARPLAPLRVLSRTRPASSAALLPGGRASRLPSLLWSGPGALAHPWRSSELTSRLPGESLAASRCAPPPAALHSIIVQSCASGTLPAAAPGHSSLPCLLIHRVWSGTGPPLLVPLRPRLSSSPSLGP